MQRALTAIPVVENQLVSLSEQNSAIASTAVSPERSNLITCKEGELANRLRPASDRRIGMGSQDR